ncbi:hypothetical protein ACJBPR_11340, partial [Streptococcus suis]
VICLLNELLEKDKLLAYLKQKVDTFDYSIVEEGTYRIGFRIPGVQSTSFLVTIKVKYHHHSY